jgi:hypothetical protein
LLTREHLQTYVGTGVASLHAWACKKPPLNIRTIESRPQEPMYPTGFRILNENAWIVHDIRINGQSQISSPIGGPDLLVGMPLLPRLGVGAHVQLDIEYIGELIAGDRFYALLDGRSADRQAVAAEASEAVTMTLDSGRRSMAFASNVVQPTRPTSILLDLGDVAHEFRLRRDQLFYRCTLNERTMIDEAIADIVDNEGAVQRPASPIMVSLRAHPSSKILYGTAEHTSDVLFEIGEHGAKCDLHGYVPSWWQTIDESLAEAS